MKSYARFYPKLLAQLEARPPFSSRDEAAQWLRDAWVDLHVQAGATPQRIRILRGAKICKEQGWVDVDKNVCYLQSPDNPPIRLYLHADGSIVLQQMMTSQNQILFAKPGKSKVVAV